MTEDIREAAVELARTTVYSFEQTEWMLREALERGVSLTDAATMIRDCARNGISFSAVLMGLRPAAGRGLT